MWYTKVVGQDPNTGETVDDWSCAISWMPTLQIEMSQTNRGQSQAIESFRNETVKGQSEFTKLLAGWKVSQAVARNKRLTQTEE